MSKTASEITKTITLNLDECAALSMYIYGTTSYRKAELETWKELAEETKDDGSPKHPDARGNANWWAKADTELEKIAKRIDEAEFTDIAVSKALENARRECSRMVREASSYDSKLAWYYTYVGEIDMAKALGYITEEKRQELADEWKKEKPEPPKARQSQRGNAR